MQGRHVVVTGGTGALGRAVVATLLQRGALCHVPVLDAKKLEGYPHAGHQGLSLYRDIDLTAERKVEAFYARLPGLWGSVHLAGGFAMSKVTETAGDDFTGMMTLNALTCFLCCREAVKTMRRLGGGQGGRIVNVAARPALEPRSGGGMVAYTASKAAVAALTQALAQEVVNEGILVNAVAPSIIDTPSNRSAMPKADHGGWPPPEEIAEVIAALVSLDGYVARGGVIPVYGRA